MKTERIVSIKPVVTKDGDQVIVTTASGAVVWVRKNQFDSSAETVSYEPRKAGEKYTTKDGKTGELKSDRNDYMGCGKASKVDFFAELFKMGITPAISL